MTDEYYMMQAIKEAKKALEDGEVPVGAVIVMNERVIARGHNLVERLSDPTAHAEIIALTSAFNALGSKYIPEAAIYITVEPCLMCAGALYWSKISKIVYGADDEKNGYKKTAGTNWPFHPKTELIRGVLKDDCAKLIKDFFKSKR
ncbi:MAG: nucleoside deaminase [Chitinophagaceae bacterium]|jgi:tRNA(adenine34) deaminase|nr:nucleoside deaminase [Chitinophagaceae bacterium]OQY92742.1 MAG: tRNA-specific adenosine deaminase [Sphingobacteriales bacterium UTBCD1]